MQTLLTNFLRGWYADVRVVKQWKSNGLQLFTMSISNSLPNRVQNSGGWESQTKTKRSTKMWRLSRMAYPKSQWKRVNGGMCSRTETTCCERVDSDWYSTRSVHIHETGGNETMINIYSKGRCGILLRNIASHWLAQYFQVVGHRTTVSVLIIVDVEARWPPNVCRAVGTRDGHRMHCPFADIYASNDWNSTDSFKTICASLCTWCNRWKQQQ